MEKPRIPAPAPVDLAGIALSIQDVLDTIPAGALIVDGRGGVLAMNAEVGRQFGYKGTDLLGQSVDILVPTGLRDGHAAMRSRALGANQMLVMGPGRSLSGQRKDGSVFPIEVGLRTIRHGGPELVLAIVSDRSDRIRALELEAQEKTIGLELAHQEIVAREMGHRVKNLMATVTALISLSARGAQSPKEMEESLRGRILALSSVIDLAFKAPDGASSHGSLTVEAILHAVLAPFMWTAAESNRVSLTGPALSVGQRPSEVLALVFHELATNAIKYGALQYPDGKLFIAWKQTDVQFELTWREEVLRRIDVSIPPEKGFGTTLMSRLIESEFGGRLDRQVTPSGWTTVLSIPAQTLGR